jgi:hypothetical protein
MVRGKTMKITRLKVITAGFVAGEDRDDSAENQDKLQYLYDNPAGLLKIKEPTEEQKEVALSEMPVLIKDLLSPVEIDFLIAVGSDGMVLEHIKNPTKKVINEALRQNGEAIKFVENPSDEQIKIAILQNAHCIKDLPKLKDELKMLALRQDGLAIQHLENPSESMQLVAVKKTPSSLSVIEHPTQKVQVEAIKADGLAIEHVKNPEEGLQLLAIDSSDMGYAYRYIDNPTPRVDVAAYKKNKQLLPFLKTVPEPVQLEVISTNIDNFCHIKEPTKKCQKMALKYIVSNPHLFDDVSNIDPEVLTEYLEEISFKEKSDKRLQIPEGLNMEQLQLYRFFQQRSKKEIIKTELKGEDWLDDKVMKIIKSVKGNNLKLSDVIDYKIPKPESELGSFIKKRFGLARIEAEPNTETEILDVPSVYFVLYVDAIKLLDLEFNKNHIFNMSKSLADRTVPYLPNQYILGYVRYSTLKQNVWIDEIWHDDKLKASDEKLEWLPKWLMELFIREMRYRDYNKFYSADAPLRMRLYKDSLDYSELLESCYFKKLVLKGFHPLVNGKDCWSLI